MELENKPKLYGGNEKYIFISYSHNASDAVYGILWKL